jgi:hypothetical protein
VARFCAAWADSLNSGAGSSVPDAWGPPIPPQGKNGQPLPHAGWTRPGLADALRLSVGTSVPFHPAMSKTFDSFFKVLFIFRLHYLCAIGLGAIFSLRRRPPAGLCSNLKLHDSWKTTSVSEMARRTHGTFALCGESFLISFIRLPKPCLMSLALQFRDFRFHPPRIQA